MSAQARSVGERQASSAGRTGVGENRSAEPGAARVVGSGEMAERIRGLEWAGTPLGPVRAWPETLLSMVNMMLGTRQPVLLMWGPEMVVLYNDAFRPILADRHPGALGEGGRTVWQDVWPVVGEQLEGVLQEGRDFFQENALVPLLRKGVLEEAWFSYSYSPVFDGEGQVAGIITICQDETATVVAERERTAAQGGLDVTLRALHAERARLLNVLQQAPVFFALLEGPEHRFAMANVHYRNLIGGREVVGKTVAEALPEVVKQGYTELLDRVYATGQAVTAQGARIELTMALERAAEERYLDFAYQPLREEDGSISGIIVLGVDVTDKRRAERALLQNEKLAAMGRMAASIAHEINNPLAAVTNLLYLARKAESFGEVKLYLETAEEELSRMAGITSQTLSFNRQSTAPRAVTCLELLNSVLVVHQSRIQKCRIKVEKQRRSERPVRCYEGEIRQVLNNLVGNAVDAMQSTGGRLVLRSRNGREWNSGREGLVITVADSGAGIPEEARKRIFEPFFTTKGMSGTGLGLWVSQGIVARHGGALRMKSRRQPGRSGTVFTLYLPFEAVERPDRGSAGNISSAAA